MNVRLLVSTNMGRTVITAFLLVVICPCVIVRLDKRLRFSSFGKSILLVSYVSIVLFLTLLDRTPGETVAVKLRPLWTYQNIRVTALRWQIYLNVFLFVPVGFLIPFSLHSRFLHTIVLTFSLSVIIEICQYAFGLGLCEIDDIIHNVIGGILGFLYWRLLANT